jgi:iron complex outermembrane receptor protein
MINSGADHKGLPSVSILIPEKKRLIYTDTNGMFEICGLPAGTKTRAVLKLLGFDSLVVSLEPGKKRQVFHLHEKDQWLDAIDVKGQHRHFESEVVEAEALHKIELERSRGMSLGEMVRKIPGVSVIQTGPTLFKPVIQGMTGQRIAIVQNGLKLEGQQWGFDHAPETDPGMANEIVVVKGAQAVRFGADAIGGAILLEPGDFSSNGKLTGQWNSGYSTNGKGFFQRLQLEDRHGSEHVFSWRVQSNLKKSGSFHTARYVLGNTAMEEISGQAILRHEYENRWKNELIYSTYYSKPGIFSGSHISSPEGIRQAFNRPDSSYQYAFSYAIGRPFQKINHQTIKAKTEYQWNSRHQTQLSVSYQKDVREEYDIIRKTSTDCPDCPQLYFRLQSRQAELSHVLKKEGMEIRGGLVGTYQSNEVERKILIPNFRMQQAGGYGIASFYRKKWAFETGARLEYRKQQIFRYVANQFDNPVRTFLNYMINAGTRYQINDHWHTKLNVQASKRAPNVNELYSNGVHQGSASFEKGDESLSAEQIFNGTFSIHHESEKWSVLFNAFETWSPDFIYLSPVGDSIITNIRGPFPFFQYRQSEANLSGIDMALRYQISHQWHISTKGSVIRGWNRTDNTWLIFQPADRADVQLSYETDFQKSAYSLEIQGGPLFVSKQYRAPEKQDFVVPPAGYILWNARVAVRKTKGRFQFDASVEGQNLANLAYRDYMNRFRYFAYDLGRNIQFRLTIPFHF